MYSFIHSFFEVKYNLFKKNTIPSKNKRCNLDKNETDFD